MNAARSKIWNSYAVPRSSVIFYLAYIMDVYIQLIFVKLTRLLSQKEP